MAKKVGILVKKKKKLEGLEFKCLVKFSTPIIPLISYDEF